MKWLNDLFYQDKERQQAQIGIVVEFAIAIIGKLDGINRHSFNNFRLRVGENTWLLQDKPSWCELAEPALLQLHHVCIDKLNNVIFTLAINDCLHLLLFWLLWTTLQEFESSVVYEEL